MPNYFPITSEEIGEIIDITEEMCIEEWGSPRLIILARKRIDLINRIKERMEK